MAIIVHTVAILVKKGFAIIFEFGTLGDNFTDDFIGEQLAFENVIVVHAETD
jgi:hypothetical protein